WRRHRIARHMVLLPLVVAPERPAVDRFEREDEAGHLEGGDPVALALARLPVQRRVALRGGSPGARQEPDEEGDDRPQRPWKPSGTAGLHGRQPSTAFVCR